jgi:hypothetical protein
MIGRSGIFSGNLIEMPSLPIFLGFPGHRLYFSAVLLLVSFIGGKTFNYDEAASLSLFRLQSTTGVATNSPLDMLTNLNINPEPAALLEPVRLTPTIGSINVIFTVQAYRFTSPLFSFNTRAYCYLGACSVPGPTFALQPEDSISYVTVQAILYLIFFSQLVTCTA